MDLKNNISNVQKYLQRVLIERKVHREGSLKTLSVIFQKKKVGISYWPTRKNSLVGHQMDF